jgi:signal transduction histidine kinase
MDTPAQRPTGLAGLFAWRRFVVVLTIAGLMGLLQSPVYVSTAVYSVVGRAMLIGVVGLIAFGIFEQWPAQLPGWVARWVLQVCAVAFVMPVSVFALYIAMTTPDMPHFWKDPLRLSGFGTMTMMGLLVGPWVAVAALFRQREIQLKTQAEAFDLQRSELERKALDSRLRLLQAQVEPHFLFNTLANVRELVVAGSPQAAAVLDTLIAYLRTAVPRLHEQATTIGQEVQLVRAYLELMHLRMPDRLQFEVQADAGALELRCPPTTLLTLVENAVRHGIDPSEEGGRIDVRVELWDGRVRVRVTDTGLGLRASEGGLGTGLAALRERLELVFGRDVQVRIAALDPHGVRAEAEFPAVRPT